MNDHDPPVDARQRYEHALVAAMASAERYLSRDQALEIAHRVANEMLELPADRVTGALIHIAVIRRLRNHWRSVERRAAMEGAYHEMWVAATRSWNHPGTALELRELEARIAAEVAAMPSGMREVFLLIRGDELSYKEVAARLGVSVSTVHTQISRASALLRDCVARYRADAPHVTRSVRTRLP
jgi:RNA polymerase sigma factor (sigma-70 family)